MMASATDVGPQDRPLPGPPPVGDRALGSGPARPSGPWHGLTVLERGWLSSNNLLLHDPQAGDWLLDSGHCVHAAQTVELVRHALQGRPLVRLLNTHLHSDHCGGNAALQRAFGVP